MAEDTKTISLRQLTAISPLDGRYRNRLENLSFFVSEYALIKNRFEIEIKYLLALSEAKVIRKFKGSEKKTLHALYENFSIEQAEAVKKIEQEVRHDVKSVERVFRLFIKNSSLENITEMIHLGLTSEDINNLAYRLMLKRGMQEVCTPTLEKIIDILLKEAKKYKDFPMLARTHGQPAVPTTLGKELIVFALRLQKESTKLKSNSLYGKLNGAVGNFNALQLIYPKINWIKFSEDFLKELGFAPNLTTTQINPYDDVVEYIQTIHRINSILIDFDQDMWRYISDSWFVQEARTEEVGSSTMPQKVNPIDFENSEGNLQIANSLIEGFTRKLPISRLQRDLSDSTTIRNVGTVLGYCLLGYTSILNGFGRVLPNKQKITDDLFSDWSILTEGVQTILRKENVPDAYSLIKNLSRGKQITQNDWEEWISNLPVNTIIKNKLKTLTPKTYIGLSIALTEKAIHEIMKLKNE